MAIIKVRKTPKSAFNPDRPTHAVVQTMVVHLQKATKRKRRLPKTEGQAAKYLVAMTRELRARKRRPSRKSASGAKARS